MSILRSVYSLSFRVCSLAGGFLSVLCISRWLPPTEAGLFFSIVATLIAFALFARLGQDKSIIPEIVHSSNKDDEIVAKTLSISFYPYLFFSSIWFMLFNIKYIWLILILYLLIFNNLMSSYLKAKFKANLSIFFENSFIYSILFILLITIYLLNNKINFNTILMSYALSVFLQFIFICILNKLLLFKIVKKCKLLNFQEFCANLLKLKEFILISYIGHFLRFFPILVVMFFFSLEDVASYKVIEQIAMSSGVIIMAINSVYAAHYAKYKQDKNRLKQNFKKSFLLSIVLGIFFILLLYIMGEIILEYSKINFTKYKDIYWIFLLTSFINIISAPVYNILLMTEREKEALNILFLAILFSCIFIVFSIITNSLFILSLSQFSFYFLLLLLSFLVFKKGVKMGDYYDKA